MDIDVNEFCDSIDQIILELVKQKKEIVLTGFRGGILPLSNQKDVSGK